MATTMPRRVPKNPEGRMPLREHLAELRRRVIISGIAIALGAVGGWFAYKRLFQALQKPLQDIADASGITANIVYNNVMQAFNLHLQISVYLGIVLASPIWLYQIWAFIVPGLTRREKWHAMAFAAAGTPLFFGGIYLGWKVVPHAVTFFAGQAEPGASVFPDAGNYFAFVTRVLLAFGLAFLLPLFLVALNMAGLMSARTMAAGWRVAVFVVFLFAAVASPTPDAGSMLALALPMCLLYAGAVGVSALLDRRRARRGGAFGPLDDDEVSEIEAPAPIDEPADEWVDPRSDRRYGERYDDIT